MHQARVPGIAPPFLENENHEKVVIDENELFYILDKLFKEKQNAIK